MFFMFLLRSRLSCCSLGLLCACGGMGEKMKCKLKFDYGIKFSMCVWLIRFSFFFNTQQRELSSPLFERELWNEKCREKTELNSFFVAAAVHFVFISFSRLSRRVNIYNN